MIRVGFLITFSDRLLGQLNYFRNLFEAIQCLNSKKIEPVVFTGSNPDPKFLKGFPATELVNTPILNRKTPLWFAHKTSQLVYNHDFILEHLLAKHKISLLSHSGTLGRNAKIKTIGWIPDFQHKHLPELFSKSELRYRDKLHQKICRECSCLIVSSYDALNDVKNFFPECVNKTEVLQFVASVSTKTSTLSLESLQEKYHFNRSYFLLPNQFWIHKNHKIVILALRLLKEKKLNPLVLLTGKTKDHRQPDHFENLLAQVDAYQLKENFHVLGVIPYNDLIALMKNAMAVINPSLFEGWSSTVEEAKSLGKKMILSDIPIHREQAPQGGLYFDPKAPETLADCMLKIILNRGAEEEKIENTAQKILIDRKIMFAKNYHRIVMKVINANKII